MRAPFSALFLCVLATCISRPVRAQDPGTAGFHYDSIRVRPSGVQGTTCYESDRYIVVEQSAPGRVGSDFFIRSSKNSRCDVDSLAGDIVLRDEWTAYFAGIADDLLFLDSGTGPDVRYLILVNMLTGRRVVEAPYVETTSGPDSFSIGVWDPSELEAPRPGCETPPGGLLPGVDSLFFVDIRSGQRRFGDRIRCANRQ